MKLRAVVIPKAGSKDYLFENIEGAASLKDPTKNTGDCDDDDGDDTSDDEDDGTGIHSNNHSWNGRCNKSIGSISSSRSHTYISQLPLKRRRLFGRKSRSYDLSKVGSKKTLPCQISDEFRSKLWPHLRISGKPKMLKLYSCEALPHHYSYYFSWNQNHLIQ